MTHNPPLERTGPAVQFLSVESRARAGPAAQWLYVMRLRHLMLTHWLNRWRERKRLEELRWVEAMALLENHTKENFVHARHLWRRRDAVGSVYHFWAQGCSPPVTATVDLDKQEARLEVGPGR